jgi:hypothetical protein
MLGKVIEQLVPSTSQLQTWPGSAISHRPGKISRGTNQPSAPCLGTAPGIPEAQPVVRLAQACSTFFWSAALPGGEIGVEQLRV